MPLPYQQEIRTLINERNLKELTTFVIVGGAYGAVGSSFTMHFNPEYFGTSTSLSKLHKHIQEILGNDEGLFLVGNASRKKKHYSKDDLHKHARLARIIQPNIAIDTGPIFTFNSESVSFHFSAHITTVDEVVIKDYNPSNGKAKFEFVDIDENIEYGDLAAFRYEAAKAAEKFERPIMAYQIKHMESAVELANLVYDMCLLTELIIPGGDNQKPRQFFATNKLKNRIRMLNEVLVAFNKGEIEEYGGLKV